MAQAGINQLNTPDRDAASEGAVPQAEVADVVQKLESSVIEDFESAVDLGLHPAEALAIIIAWAAAETRRFNANDTGLHTSIY